MPKTTLNTLTISQFLEVRHLGGSGLGFLMRWQLRCWLEAAVIWKFRAKDSSYNLLLHSLGTGLSSFPRGPLPKVPRKGHNRDGLLPEKVIHGTKVGL